jgi:hypothetical protein
MIRLDKLTDVAIILLCIGVGCDLGYRYFVSPSRTTLQTTESKRQYRPGETLQPIPGLSLRPLKNALLFVVSSGCTYCHESVPFYQELMAAVRASPEPVQLVGVCLESQASCTAYFKSKELVFDAVVGVERGTVKIAGTPTLLLVDERRTIKSVWTGLLPAGGQTAVRNAILGKNAATRDAS